jgi:hypothetical protein
MLALVSSRGALDGRAAIPVPVAALTLSSEGLVRIQPVVDPSVASAQLEYQIAFHQLFQRRSHLLNHSLNPLFQQPPLHDPFEGILSLRVQEPKLQKRIRRRALSHPARGIHWNSLNEAPLAATMPRGFSHGNRIASDKNILLAAQLAVEQTSDTA